MISRRFEVSPYLIRRERTAESEKTFAPKGALSFGGAAQKKQAHEGAKYISVTCGLYGGFYRWFR